MVGERFIIKNNLKKQSSTYLATISTVPIEQKIIEKEEELVEWETVKKLDTSRKLVCQTCPYEDLFQNINNDIEEMKRTVSEVYALQEKKQVKNKNKVKPITIDVQGEIKKDNYKDEKVLIKKVKEKQVKPKNKVAGKQRINNKPKNKNNNNSNKKNIGLNPKIFNYFKIKIRKKT